MSVDMEIKMENPFGRRWGARDERRKSPLALRPMTGHEEEIVESRRGEANTAALCNEILARCLVLPGADVRSARARVRALLVAERDAALCELRRISLGSHIKSRVFCPSCGEENAVDFDLGTLPIAVPETKETIEVSVEGDIRVTLRLPTAGDQEDLLDEGLEGDSQRRSFLLSRAIARYGEREGPFDYEFARALPIGVRNALESALEQVIPDLDLSMVVSCHICAHGFSAPFDVASFFLPR